MQRTLTCLLSLTLIFVSILFALTYTSMAQKSSGFDYDSVFRLHIIANSDSEYDQSVKLYVRDALLKSEYSLMNDACDVTSAKTSIMSDGAKLTQTVRDALCECGADYGVQLKIGTYTFPERDYASITYPAGEYQALRVILGNGDGKNWWCVMFPPLCILDCGNGQIDPNKLDSILVKLLKSIDGGRLWETIKEKLCLPDF